MLRTVAATLMAIILVSACSAASSPAPSPGTSPATGTSPAESGGFDPSAITGTAILSGWQSSPAEGNALTQTLLQLPVGIPERQGRLSTAWRRLRRWHGGQVRLGRRPRRVLRRRRLRPAVDRPGVPGSARRLHREVRRSILPSSSTATPRSSRAPMARPTACRRTATRSRWPTTRPWSQRHPRPWKS